MADKLNAKQKRFCEEYVLDWNANAAARRAGYSESSARAYASKLLQTSAIQKHIKFLQSDTARLAGVSHLMIVNELKKIAFTNIADMYADWETWKSFDDIPDHKKAAIAEIQRVKNVTKYGESEVLKIKMQDKVRALENLSRQLGFDAPVKIDHTTAGEALTQAPVIISPTVLPKSVQSDEEE